MTEIQILSRELDQLAMERDDFIEITSLPTNKGWKALARKLDAKENMQLDALRVEISPQHVNWLQGFLAALQTVRETVANASEETTNIAAEIAEKQQQKDDALDHQE